MLPSESKFSQGDSEQLLSKKEKNQQGQQILGRGNLSSIISMLYSIHSVLSSFSVDMKFHVAQSSLKFYIRPRMMC